MDVAKFRLRRLQWKAVTRRRWQKPPRVAAKFEARGRGHNAKVDIVGLGNLCIDVRLSVSRLPRQRPGWRHAFMKDFLQNPPDNAMYEPGGVMNTVIMASRLGLEAAAVGHVGADGHGKFCISCLENEGIPFVHGFDVTSHHSLSSHSCVQETSVCLVIVDPAQRHLFCSTFQVEPGPVFHHPSNFSKTAMQQIREAKALFMNGYTFQECSGEVIEYAFEEAIQAKTATFFDPGPYGAKLNSGSTSDREALRQVMHRSSVVLATEEEAMAVTGASDAIEAGRKMMRHPKSFTNWVVIKLGAKGSMFLQRDVPEVQYTAGFKVDVSDTVGCGDSFGAAVVYGHLHRQGERPNGVMELANAIGAITATKQGAGRNVADLESVKALLERRLEESRTENGIADVTAALDLLKMEEQSHLYAQNHPSCQQSSIKAQAQEGCLG